MTVHDLAGREVARLADGWTDAGHHSMTFRGDGLKSGVYWFRLSADGGSAVHRSVVLR